MSSHVGGLREVAARFDALLVDVWGVLHTGDGLFPGVLATLEALAAAERRVVFLTNTSRLGDAVAETLHELGIDSSLYEDIVTAGDVTRTALLARQPGRPRCLHFGAASFVPWLFELDFDFTENAADAELIVATGALADAVALEGALAELAPALERGVPLVCTNPDRIIPTAQGPRLGPGAVARAYADRGGATFLYGKPHRAIYAEAMRRLALDAARILALGDTLETDIRGARDAGVASALVVGSGVHAGEAAALDALFERERLAPDFVVERFRW